MKDKLPDKLQLHIWRELALCWQSC